MNRLTVKELLARLDLEACRELATFGALSDECILALLNGGEIWELAAGERIERYDEPADDFQVVLSGRTAFYKRGDGCQVLTRYFHPGDQVGFDLMIGLIPHNGTDVAEEPSVLLNIDKALFYRLHVEYPEDFGLLMINLARELAREIEILEDLITDVAPASRQTG